MSDKIATGTLRGSLSDSALQTLAAQTLRETTKDIEGKLNVLGLNSEQYQATHNVLSEITEEFKPAYIQGIINAEKSRWKNGHDNLPSYDYLHPERRKEYQGLYRTLFTASLPFTYFAKTGTAGFWVVGTAAGVAAGVAVTTTGLVALGILSAPVSLPLLAIGGTAFALAFGYIGISVATAFKDPNSSVGRGQITGASWQDAIDHGFARYFNLDYFPTVLEKIQVSEQAQEFMRSKAIDPNGINSLSISFNPLSPDNMRIIDNYMIGAVLLDKILARHRNGERNKEDVIKYGIGMYKSGVGYLNGIAHALGSSDSLAFPARTAIADSRLDSEQQDTIRYVYEVYDYAQSH